jgi:hypothetical protein
MPVWKVLFIVVLFSICLALAAATLIYPTTVGGGQHPWLWAAGLLAATVVMGTLFTLFLRKVSASMGRS